MASIGYRVRKRAERAILPMLFRKSRRPEMRRFGSGYSGYWVPTSGLSCSSVCYSAGGGEDISFDPAPRSIP